MKLNAKGMELYDKWEHIYHDELAKQREQREDPDWSEGWCIIDDADHCKTIEDCVGLAIFGDDDNAIYHILENYSANEHYAYGYSAEKVVEMMFPYFDVSPVECLDWSDWISDSMTDDDWKHLHDNDPRKDERVLCG